MKENKTNEEKSNQTTKEKKFFDDTIILQIAEQISILDVAKEYGLSPVEKGRYYSLAEHDSVIIYPETNSFFRHKTGVGGDIFHFMKEMPEIGKSFKDVYFEMLPKIDRSIEPKSLDRKSIKPKTVLEMNTRTINFNESLSQCEQREKELMSQINKDTSTKNVRAYLVQTRCIDPEIVDEFIKKGLIIQDCHDGYKNAVFVGYNGVGLICSLNKRSCSSQGKFKGDIMPSNYAYGWRYDPDIKNYRNLYKTEFYNRDKPLICFEGYIDMLAYLSILKDKKIDYRKNAYLVCGSVTKKMSVVAAVKVDGYKKVIIAFDNDEAGDLHAVKLAKEIKEQCGEDIIVKRQRSYLKDWDEDRIAIKHQDKSLLDKVIEAKKILEKQQQNKNLEKSIKCAER